ncbi:MAG: SdpI family protein [Chitinophagaceae bacterium]
MNKLLSKIVWLVILAPVIYLAIIWGSLPARIAIHYNIHGEPDGYGSKVTLVGMTLFLVFINAGAYLLLVNAHRIDPRKNAIENKDKMQRLGFAVTVFISAILFMIIHSSSNTGMKFEATWVLAGVGLLFAIMGNYLYTIKPSYFAGFRLPWAMQNAENWRKTHLLAGKLWFGGGLLIAVVSLFAPALVSIICFGIVIAIITVVPCIYSYNLHKETKTL